MFYFSIIYQFDTVCLNGKGGLCKGYPDSSRGILTKSVSSTSKTFAILISKSRLGCVELVTHY